MTETGWDADIDVRRLFRNNRTMTKRLMLAIAMVSGLTGCSDFDEPAWQDPKSIYGCYTALNAPPIALTSEGVKIEGVRETTPLHYEYKKVGAILRIPFSAKLRDGRYEFERSDDHFFRVLHTADGPLILVAFGPAGIIKKYRRISVSGCAS